MIKVSIRIYFKGPTTLNVMPFSTYNTMLSFVILSGSMLTVPMLSLIILNAVPANADMPIAIMFSFLMLIVSHYNNCRYADCHYNTCRYADCHYNT